MKNKLFLTIILLSASSIISMENVNQVNFSLIHETQSNNQSYFEPIYKSLDSNNGKALAETFLRIDDTLNSQENQNIDFHSMLFFYLLQAQLGIGRPEIEKEAKDPYLFTHHWRVIQECYNSTSNVMNISEFGPNNLEEIRIDCLEEIIEDLIRDSQFSLIFILHKIGLVTKKSIILKIKLFYMEIGEKFFKLLLQAGLDQSKQMCIMEKVTSNIMRDEHIDYDKLLIYMKNIEIDPLIQTSICHIIERMDKIKNFKDKCWTSLIE